jgi:hypothetical protein
VHLLGIFLGDQALCTPAMLPRDILGYTDKIRQLQNGLQKPPNAYSMMEDGNEPVVVFQEKDK